MKPMLAGKYDPALAVFPVLASPKLDGIRVLGLSDQLLSRKLLPIPNVHAQAKFGRMQGFDGELIAGPPTAHDVYNTTASVVMSQDKPILNLQWFLFDVLGMDQRPYIERYEHLVLKAPIHQDVAVLPHTRIDGADELAAYEAKMINEGYEGIMVRALHGHYKQGRSTAREGWLLKVKRFEDSEAIITDVLEEEANTNEATRDNLGRTKRSSAKAGKVGKDRMGKLACLDIHTGVDFHLGTGFNDAQRAWFWQHRTKLARDKVIVKYKFFPVGVKDRPRHPVYIGLRSEIDL